MIALLVMTDGRRDCIAQTIPSALAHLDGPITRRVICDDSADPDYGAWLAERFPSFTVASTSHRLGFGGSIQRAWTLLAQTPERFVFHLEDDFLFTRPVDLAEMAAVLDANPDLLQLALLRQPWNPEERAAGGIVARDPGAYTPRAGWLEHRRFFTTNPSLYRSSLMAQGWPREDHSEGVFGLQLLADPAVRFGFWGAGEEWVTHIGAERAGTGY